MHHGGNLASVVGCRKLFTEGNARVGSAFPELVIQSVHT